ncbi:MAG: hypothetical protein WBX27_21625, partial [Specibacter sp.]
ESCEATLHNWLKKADIEDGTRPGVTEKEAGELRDAKKRIRLLEQENGILRRAAAFFARGSPAVTPPPAISAPMTFTNGSVWTSAPGTDPFCCMLG